MKTLDLPRVAAVLLLVLAGAWTTATRAGADGFRLQEPDARDVQQLKEEVERFAKLRDRPPFEGKDEALARVAVAIAKKAAKVYGYSWPEVAKGFGYEEAPSLLQGTAERKAFGKYEMILYPRIFVDGRGRPITPQQLIVNVVQLGESARASHETEKEYKRLYGLAKENGEPEEVFDDLREWSLQAYWVARFAAVHRILEQREALGLDEELVRRLVAERELYREQLDAEQKKRVLEEDFSARSADLELLGEDPPEAPPPVPASHTWSWEQVERGDTPLTAEAFGNGTTHSVALYVESQVPHETALVVEGGTALRPEDALRKQTMLVAWPLVATIPPHFHGWLPASALCTDVAQEAPPPGTRLEPLFPADLERAWARGDSAMRIGAAVAARAMRDWLWTRAHFPPTGEMPEGERPRYAPSRERELVAGGLLLVRTPDGPYERFRRQGATPEATSPLASLRGAPVDVQPGDRSAPPQPEKPSFEAEMITNHHWRTTNELTPENVEERVAESLPGTDENRRRAVAQQVASEFEALSDQSTAREEQNRDEGDEDLGLFVGLDFDVTEKAPPSANFGAETARRTQAARWTQALADAVRGGGRDGVEVATAPQVERDVTDDAEAAPPRRTESVTAASDEGAPTQVTTKDADVTPPAPGDPEPEAEPTTDEPLVIHGLWQTYDGKDPWEPAGGRLRAVIEGNRLRIVLVDGFGNEVREMEDYTFDLEGDETLEDYIRALGKNPPPRPSAAELEKACRKGAIATGNYRVFARQENHAEQDSRGGGVYEVKASDDVHAEHAWEIDCRTGKLVRRLYFSFTRQMPDGREVEYGFLRDLEVLERSAWED